MFLLQRNSPRVVPLGHSMFPWDRCWLSSAGRSGNWESVFQPPSIGVMGGGPTVFPSSSISNRKPFCFTTYNRSGQTGVWENNNSQQEQAGKKESGGHCGKVRGTQWARAEEGVRMCSIGFRVHVWEAGRRKSEDLSHRVQGEKEKATLRLMNKLSEVL